LAALGINLGYLLVQILNFAIMFIVLRAWVFKPIIELLMRRRQAIAQGLEDARVAAEARANAEQEAQGILAKAQQDAAHVVREATERAEQVALEIKVAAEHEAEKVREDAAEAAEQARIQTLAELRGEVAGLAIAAAQKLIGEALDEKRQRNLVAEFFSGLKAGRVVVMEDRDLAGSSAEVTSALPLTSEEQATVRDQVLKQMGGGATISFRVDPRILGGLVIRVGDKVLDGSVSAQLESLRQSLR
jgi:F-type H+-transporting ATPase subunit b